jgi:plasmid stability protein
MPTLQVRDLPADLYAKLSYLAEREHRSLAQETIVLLKESIENKFAHQNRRKKVLENFDGLNIDGKNLPDQIELIREDRER